MSFETKQLFQHRENSTNAVNIFSCGVNEEVEVSKIIFVNTSAAKVKICLFHDDDGTIYDESTAIMWNLEIEPGFPFPWTPRIDMNNYSGSLGFSVSVANAITITGYGSVTTK